MKLSIFFVLLSMMFVCCCSSERIHITHAHRISSEFTNHIKKTYPNVVVSSKGGCYLNDVEQIHIGYELQGYMNIEEARCLYVKEAEYFIYMINSDKQIRPYLHNFPVTIDNINLVINFSAQNHQFVSPPFVAYISAVKGKLDYAIDNKEANRLETIHVEPYEEAVRIVKEECLAL